MWLCTFCHVGDFHLYCPHPLTTHSGTFQGGYSFRFKASRRVLRGARSTVYPSKHPRESTTTAPNCSLNCCYVHPWNTPWADTHTASSEQWNTGSKILQCRHSRARKVPCKCPQWGERITHSTRVHLHCRTVWVSLERFSVSIICRHQHTFQECQKDGCCCIVVRFLIQLHSIKINLWLIV